MTCACASVASAVFIPPEKVGRVEGTSKAWAVALVNTQEGRTVDD